MVSQVSLSVTTICSYLLFIFCFIHLPFSANANEENVPENHAESNEDSPQFHNKMSNERRHLLAHLADRMDLDGEGLRHIQQHLGQQVGDTEQNKDLKDVAEGDDAKGIFYFFKFHDFDDNQKLDGLEWMQALTDFHQDDDNGEVKEGGKMFLEHEAEAIVDELLTKHDKNDDGMIDFIELMNSNVNSIMTDLDKPHPEEDGHNAHEQQQQQNAEEHSSLEQELNQHQQDQTQQEQNQGQQQDNRQPQEDQQHEQQSQDNQQQELNSEEKQGDQTDGQQQNEPTGSSLEEEYNQQQQ